MRKILFITAIAVLGTLGLGACSSGDQGQATAPANVTRPTATAVDDAIKDCRAKHPEAAASSTSAQAADASDDPCIRSTVAATTWQPYMQQLVTANMGKITNPPYAYFVPSGKYPENQDAVSRVQDSVNGTVAATVLPGNMVAVGGPDSATTAQVLETAFKQAAPGSFKGVVVLFMGDRADEAAVKAAVDPSGATFKFVQM